MSSASLAKPSFLVSHEIYNEIDSVLDLISSLNSEPDVVQRATDLFVGVQNLVEMCYKNLFPTYEVTFIDILNVVFVEDRPSFNDLCDLRHMLLNLQISLADIAQCVIFTEGACWRFYNELIKFQTRAESLLLVKE